MRICLNFRFSSSRALRLWELWVRERSRNRTRDSSSALPSLSLQPHSGTDDGAMTELVAAESLSASWLEDTSCMSIWRDSSRAMISIPVWRRCWRDSSRSWKGLMLCLIIAFYTVVVLSWGPNIYCWLVGTFLQRLLYARETLLAILPTVSLVNSPLKMMTKVTSPRRSSRKRFLCFANWIRSFCWWCLIRRNIGVMFPSMGS